MTTAKQITITRPDDWHIHLRDGIALERTVTDAVAYCARALIMPNLEPPILNTEAAHAYRQRIKAMVGKDQSFEPLMTLYLNENTKTEEIKRAVASDFILAAKLYPQNVTTGSASGVRELRTLYPVFAAMQKYGMVLAVHAESNDADIDIFDREAVFLEQQLSLLIDAFPELKIVIEHISTEIAVDFVLNASVNIAATITAHHLRYHRNHLLAYGINPHFYCAPLLKRHSDRHALCLAAVSGNKKFFMGTDSAPHSRDDKENACGCAGCYTAPSALCDYTEIFENHDALNRLEAFVAHNGADFYGVARNQEHLTLSKKPWQLPSQLPMGKGWVVPLDASRQRNWCIAV